MRALATPCEWNHTPAWRAAMWRDKAFGTFSPLSTWHPKSRDGEWYHSGYPDRIFGDVMPPDENSWRRGIWTGGRHEAEARIDHHRWLWWAD